MKTYVKILQHKTAYIIILTLENKHLQYKQEEQEKNHDGRGENVSLSSRNTKGMCQSYI